MEATRKTSHNVMTFQLKYNAPRNVNTGQPFKDVISTLQVLAHMIQKEKQYRPK